MAILENKRSMEKQIKEAACLTERRAQLAVYRAKMTSTSPEPAEIFGITGSTFMKRRDTAVVD